MKSAFGGVYRHLKKEIRGGSGSDLNGLLTKAPCSHCLGWDCYRERVFYCQDLLFMVKKGLPKKGA